MQQLQFNAPTCRHPDITHSSLSTDAWLVTHSLNIALRVLLLLCCLVILLEGGVHKHSPGYHYERREYEHHAHEHPEQYHKDPRYKAEYDYDYQQYYSRQAPEYKPGYGYKGPGPYDKAYQKPEYYEQYEKPEYYEQYEKPEYYKQYEKPEYEQEQYYGEDAYYGDDDSEMPLSCWA
jgi:hypothetical protein